MFKWLMFIALVAFSGLSFGSEHQMIDTLGVSPKGQYVALEEYGYKSQNHTYYVKIKVINVWTKEYVGNSIDVELPAHRPNYLLKARARAKMLAHDVLKRFDISG
jgi:predicted secreted protein